MIGSGHRHASHVFRRLRSPLALSLLSHAFLSMPCRPYPSGTLLDGCRPFWLESWSSTSLLRCESILTFSSFRLLAGFSFRDANGEAVCQPDTDRASSSIGSPRCLAYSSCSFDNDSTAETLYFLTSRAILTLEERCRVVQFPTPARSVPPHGFSPEED